MEGATDLQYTEVPCQRQVADSSPTNNQFAQGTQDYSFTIGKGMAFYPSRSYFKFTVKLNGTGRFYDAGGPFGVGGKPAISEQLALSENFAPNMYTSMYFLGGGQNISSIVNYLPQVNQVETRATGSQAWLKSVGMSAAYSNPNFSSRVNAVSAALANTDQNAGNNENLSFESRGVYGLSLEEGKTSYRKPIAATATFATATITDNHTTTFVGTGTALLGSDVGSTLVVGGYYFNVVDIAPPAGGTQAITVDKISNRLAGFITTDWYLIARNLTTSTEGHSVIQSTWFPSCLGIFNEKSPLGAGDYRLQLSPDANYKINAIESVLPGYVGHSFQVLDVKFYACVARFMIPDQVRPLYLTEYQAQSKVMSTNAQNLSWTVPASTYELYVFLQSGVAGNSVAFPPSKFQAENNAEQNLVRIQCTYANVSRPQTLLETGFTNNINGGTSLETSNNLLTQLYTSSLLETDRYDLEGGAESFNDFLARGPMYVWKWAKSEFDLSTQVQLQIEYSANSGSVEQDVTTPFPTNSRVFLVAKYTRTVNITTQGGMVVAVNTLNV